jgi:glutamyl-tRNA synthetase
MRITHVIRGDDHISNTPRQIAIFRALGLPHPVYAHASMILGADGTRLSKRHGATSVESFRDLGFIPEAMVNFLALLGWALDGERELFSLPELEQVFSLERVGANPAVFNLEKLEWMNGQYLRAMPLPDRVARVLAFLAETGGAPEASAVGDVDAFLARAVEAVGDRLKTLSDVEGYAGFAFRDPVDIAPEALAELVKRPEADRRLLALADCVAAVEPFDLVPLEEAVRALAESLGVKAGELFSPARVALTGRKVAPGIFEVMRLLGKRRTVERLRAGAAAWQREQAAQRQSS